MAVVGAIVMYIVSMLALFKLRRTEPNLERPFRAPLYPIAPAVALGLAVLALVAMVYYNFLIAVIFAVLFVIGFVYFKATHKSDELAEGNEMLRANAL